jgi:hypothetical protein
MRRWLAVAALGAAFLALPAWGQRRGGGASGGFAGRAGFATRGPVAGGRGPMTMSRGPAFAGVQRGGVHFVMGGFGHPFHSPFFFHGRRYFRSWPYGGYYGYPYYSYPLDYGDNSYSSDSYRNYPASDYSTPYADNSRQQAEIDRLENEVDRLREERNAQAPSASQGRPRTELPPTEIVFRDKRTEEVQNYAIVGKTFWVLDAQRAKKIPLAELDIAATKKANDDRGVEFQLPE